MAEQEQKPFLTVETGEAFQPIRLSYELLDKAKFKTAINKIKCCETNPHRQNSWLWYWHDECTELPFESLESFDKKGAESVCLGTISIRDNIVTISLSSFKRACLAIPFFHTNIKHQYACIKRADFINKVFGIDEQLPRGYDDVFDEHELKHIAQAHMQDQKKIEQKIDTANKTEDKLNILTNQAKDESTKPLPFAERYEFSDLNSDQDPDTIFLGFYIFLRSRELVAIRQWFGETDYTLYAAEDETIQQVFGDLGLDLLD